MPRLSSQAGTCRLRTRSGSSSPPKVSIRITGDRPVALAGGGGVAEGTEGVTFSFAMIEASLHNRNKRSYTKGYLIKSLAAREIRLLVLRWVSRQPVHR